LTNLKFSEHRLYIFQETPNNIVLKQLRFTSYDEIHDVVCLDDQAGTQKKNKNSVLNLTDKYNGSKERAHYVFHFKVWETRSNGTHDCLN